MTSLLRSSSMGRSAAFLAALLVTLPALALDKYEDAERQLRQCLVASKNRRDLGNANANFPDTQRLTISKSDFAKLEAYFKLSQTHDDEFKHLYPAAKFRFEVASSGSQGHNQVHDLKISPILANNGSGTTIFNYHIQVE